MVKSCSFQVVQKIRAHNPKRSGNATICFHMRTVRSFASTKRLTQRTQAAKLTQYGMYQNSKRCLMLSTYHALLAQVRATRRRIPESNARPLPVLAACE